MSSWSEIIGLIGVGMTLLAYLLLQFRILSSDRLSYSFLNVVGSLGIMYSLWYAWNLAAWIMECSWLVMSIYGMFQSWRHHHK